jgi:hypothetical protein
MFFSPDLRDLIDASRINLQRHVSLQIFQARRGAQIEGQQNKKDILLHEQHVVEEDLNRVS